MIDDDPNPAPLFGGTRTADVRTRPGRQMTDTSTRKIRVRVTEYSDASANTGSTTDDRTDIACWIGSDLMPNFGDALTAADRILASKWLAETIAGAKVKALSDAAKALGIDRAEGSTFLNVVPAGSADWASRHAEKWLRARAAEYRK